MHFFSITLIAALFLAANAANSCKAVRECLAKQKCNILPIPKTSLPSPISPAGYTLTEIRPGVYSWSDTVYLSLILFRNRRLTLVDFTNGASSFKQDGTYLLNVAVADLLKGETPERVDMVYSHRHIDHIGGAPAFFKYLKETFPSVTILIWGTSDVVSFLARNPKSRIPKPNVIVADAGRTIYLSPNLRLELTIFGGHVTSDLVAHVLPSRDGPGIAHYVDVINPGFAPFLNFGVTTDLGRYVSAQEDLLKLSFRTLSPGHIRLGSKEDIRINLAYTRDVIRCAGQVLRSQTPELLAPLKLERVFDPTRIEFGNVGWAAVQSLGFAEDRCARKIIEKWGCKLGSVAVFSRSHCKSAFIYLSIEVEM